MIGFAVASGPGKIGLRTLGRTGRRKANCTVSPESTLTSWIHHETLASQCARWQLDIVRGSTTSHIKIHVVNGIVITASITNEAVDELGLEKGDDAAAVIKPSDAIAGKR
jgi:molybdopterin-binding protein